jgi:hypothetical protein
MFYRKHPVRLDFTYVLFQLNTRTRYHSLPFVQSLMYILRRGRHFCLILVKTRTHMCKTTHKYTNITWYELINAQNNHIFELLKIVIAFFIEELTKNVYNADAGRFDCNAVRLSRCNYFYYEGLLDITHFSLEKFICGLQSH